MCLSQCVNEKLPCEKEDINFENGGDEDDELDIRLKGKETLFERLNWSRLASIIFHDRLIILVSF